MNPTEETLKTRLKNRSNYFKIEIRKDRNLTYPSGGPTELKSYADPVNLFYPTHTATDALESAINFKKDSSLYESFASIQTVESYLRQGLEKYGVTLEKAEDLCKILDSGFDEVVKMDEEWRIAVGIVYTAKDKFDAHNDRIRDPLVLRDAAFNFAKNLNVGAGAGVMHQEFNKEVYIVGTWFTPVQMTMNGKDIPENTWIVMTQYVDKEVWQKVKDGTYKGFSLGGLGRRVEAL